MGSASSMPQEGPSDVKLLVLTRKFNPFYQHLAYITPLFLNRIFVHPCAKGCGKNSANMRRRKYPDSFINLLNFETGEPELVPEATRSC